MTLLPGDLLATGACAGLGIALGKFLRPSVVRVEIDPHRHIETCIFADPR